MHFKHETWDMRAQQDDCIVISEISRRDVSCITEKGEIYYDGKIKSHA